MLLARDFMLIVTILLLALLADAVWQEFRHNNRRM